MKQKKRIIKSAFVLGSTSEVARSICRELAKRGCKNFHLVARNSTENEKKGANFYNFVNSCFNTGSFNI